WGDFGKEMNSFDLPTGIDIDSSGGIYLADSENNRVLYFMGFVDK
ncbi:MAG TPA: 6-bladed beta-propeller, partial [Chloroflexi bacterium]|nr:6-bladed beta-propeller [Chloroflexota bacterium]